MISFEIRERSARSLTALYRKLRKGEPAGPEDYRDGTRGRNRWPASEHAAARAMYDKIVQGDRTVVAFKPKA